MAGMGMGGAGSMVPAAFPMYNPSMAAAYGPFGGAFPTNMSSTQQPLAVASQKQVDDLEAKLDAVAANAKFGLVAVATSAKHAARVAEAVAESTGIAFKRPAINMDSNWLRDLNMKEGPKRLKVIDNGFAPQTDEGKLAYKDVMDMFEGDNHVNRAQVEIMAKQAATEADDEALARAPAGAPAGAAGGSAGVAHLELFRKNMLLSDPGVRLKMVKELHNDAKGAELRKFQKQFTDNNKDFGFGFCAWATDPFLAPDPATIADWRAFKATNNFPAGDDWDGV